MPHQLEAFKIAELANINQRRMLLTIIIATIFGVFVAFWVQLQSLLPVRCRFRLLRTVGTRLR